jgi:hypothetical protein
MARNSDRTSLAARRRTSSPRRRLNSAASTAFGDDPQPATGHRCSVYVLVRAKGQDKLRDTSIQCGQCGTCAAMVNDGRAQR